MRKKPQKSGFQGEETRYFFTVSPPPSEAAQSWTLQVVKGILPSPLQLFLILCHPFLVVTQGKIKNKKREAEN